MRNKVGCEGGGENAAKPASKMGAVVGLSHGMARPVQKLRTKAPKSCSWSTWSWALFRRSPPPRKTCQLHTNIAWERKFLSFY
jgi:hypothetical protein